MQKVSVIGLDEIKGRLIARMMDLEAVELTDQTDKLSDEFWAENLEQDGAQDQVTYFEGKISRSSQALDIIDEYGGLKKPLFKTRRSITPEQAGSIPSQEIETEDLIERLIHLNEQLRSKRDEINRIDLDNIMFEPWIGLDVPLGETVTETMTTIVGVLPLAFTPELVEEKLGEMTDRYVFRQINEDKALRYLAAIVPKELENDIESQLKDAGFQALDFKGYTKSVEEIIHDNAQERIRLQDEIDGIINEIRELAEKKSSIEEYEDILTIELDKRRTRSKLLKTKRAFYLEGWVPVEREEAVNALLEENGCIYEYRDPEEGENVPVLLKNNSRVYPVEAITDMYSLPAYGTFDPTRIFSPWYICFFGMMFSDACYGLIMVVVLGYVLKKYDLEGSMYKMIKLLFYCGISTTFWGVMFGGYFGNVFEVLAETFFGKTIDIKPLWFDPLDDPLKLLIISIALGVAHLFLGLGIQGYLYLRDGKMVDFFCDIILWYATVIGLFLWIGGGMIGDTAQTIGKWLSIISIVGLALTGGRDRKGAGKVIGGFSNVYNITGWLSDILSYARILALGLATGAIAQVVNTMGALAGGGIVGAIVFLLVFIFGHLLNFAINALGAFIHAARLQFVEFFGKFYVDGGEAFEPLKKNTKYIKIENEINS